MPGLSIIIPRSAPVGTPGPVIDPLHSAGVADYTDRFVASRMQLAIGSDVSTWENLGSGGDLIKGATSTPITLTAGVNNAPVVRLTSTAAANGLLEVPETTTTPITIALVGRITGFSNDSSVGAGGMVLRRAGNGSWQINPIGSGAVGGSVNVSETATNAEAGFRLAALDPSAPALRTNSVESTTLSGAAMTPGTTYTRLRLVTTGDAQILDVYEVIKWNRALDATERAAVYNALKAQYSFIG